MTEALSDFQGNLSRYQETFDTVKSLQKKVDWEDSPRQITSKLGEEISPLIGSYLFKKSIEKLSKYNSKAGDITKSLTGQEGAEADQLTNPLGSLSDLGDTISDLGSRLNNVTSEVGSRLTDIGSDVANNLDPMQLVDRVVPETGTGTGGSASSLSPNDTMGDILNDSDKFKEWAGNQDELSGFSGDQLENIRQAGLESPESFGGSLDRVPNDLNEIIRSTNILDRPAELTGAMRGDSTLARALGGNRDEMMSLQDVQNLSLNDNQSSMIDLMQSQVSDRLTDPANITAEGVGHQESVYNLQQPSAEEAVSQLSGSTPEGESGNVAHNNPTNPAGDGELEEGSGVTAETGTELQTVGETAGEAVGETAGEVGAEVGTEAVAGALAPETLGLSELIPLALGGLFGLLGIHTHHAPKPNLSVPAFQSGIE